MNIVKGVADLLRRSSGGDQAEDNASWSRSNKLSSPPSLNIRFRDVGEEALLRNIWDKYDATIDKAEKRKLLLEFLKYFVQIYHKWEPANDGEFLTDSSQGTSGQSLGPKNLVLGCSFGHPSEVILILIQEVARIYALVSESNAYDSQGALESSLKLGDEIFCVLDSMIIITRAVHNCRVFSYYGGVQKVTALMKAVVIQLKTLSAGVSSDGHLSGMDLEKTELLLRILTYVISTIFSFMNLNPDVHAKIQHITARNYLLKDCRFKISSDILLKPVPEATYHWQQKAVVLMMEAGGVNWLVELLRVIRRLGLKEQWTRWLLEHLTLSCLKCALLKNTRAQNHFRSIGGLEVLLDALALSSSSLSVLGDIFLSESEGGGSSFFAICDLQLFFLEVLRDSVFGNLNNLQFLCENGRIQKFANSICSPAYMLQEFQNYMVASSECRPGVCVSTPTTEFSERIHSSAFLVQDSADDPDSSWTEYCLKLSQLLCSFLVSNEDVNLNVQASSGQCSAPISFVYWELSIKWFMKILMAAFPCIRACSSGNELPSNLRILANSLQHHTLHTFRKFLAGAPKLLEVFREEGIWGFIFSEKFFYFGAFLEEFSTEADSSRDDSLKVHGMPSTSKFSKDSIKHNEVVILQMEAISFLEFAATLCGNTYNLPECSALLDTLEQSACNPEIAIMLVKSLHRILQLATEQTFAALEELDAIARLLKVACIQAQEYSKFGDTKAQKEFHIEGQPIDSHISGLVRTANTWVECMKAVMDLFTEYLSSSHHGRSLVLHNAKCIDCLFNLLWEECLASQILDHILGLMKVPASPSADRVAMLQLCSKYLETFTIAKEKGSDFVELAIDLLVGMKDVLLLDQLYYQALFREAECFLHIVSMLNGTLDDKFGEPLILNVLQTLTLLLVGNDMSKSAFRALAGVGYQTLQNLLLNFCHSQPSLGLLNALLDMLVDGRFANDGFSLIKNEDAVMLFLVVLQKSSATLQHYGLDILLRLLKDSIINRIISSKAGMLGFILDWFFVEEAGDIIMKLAQLIQIIGGHSVSGKDIRKMFAILRSEKMGSNQKYSSLLLTSIYSMLKEKGPTAFFDFSGHDSGIVIKTPVQWPYNRGFSFSCWIRIESFPEAGLMSLFCFFTDNGRGSSAMIGKDKLVFESINQKRQSVELSINFLQKKWHFLCITHSIGRAFSGGSIMRCYLDGDLVSSDKCRYAKITDALTRCSIGSHISVCDESNSQFPSDYVMPFLGQIGPVYMFGDALSPEQVKGIYLLGPTYMYSFIGNEVSNAFDSSHPLGLFDAKDGFSSKIVFGLNAQASDGRILFNVSTMHERLSDKNVFEAAVLEGTRLCCRRMLKEIIYCVGGVSVFFPLLTPLDCSGTSTANDYMLMRSVTSNKLAGEVIELVASVLDENLANQQQMHLLSGFPILGFLFQHVPPKHLNMEMLSSLKRLFHIVKSCGMSELLLKDAISWIYLNPQIWTSVDYEVQRELYMFLIQHFENDMAHLKKICDLPRVIDIICQFYWDKADCSLAFGTKSLLNLVTRQVITERPCAEEIRKIRLLLLSLAEMSLMPKVEKSDIKALIAFFERSNDMVCIEDVLQMVLRTFSQKVLSASFLEQVNLLGGCSIFVNLLQRDSEPIRLLGLQLLGKLLTGFPSEKKGQHFFSLSVGRSRLVSDSYRKSGLTRVEPLILVMSDRLFRFPLSDNLCATLFDVLLGGASPKQILQKRSLSEKNINKKGRSGLSSHFCVPQILILIFNFLASCNDSSAREKILKDLLDLLDSSPSNIEALAENGWCYWLDTSSKLDILQSLEVGGQSGLPIDSNKNEEYLVRNVFSIVLSHYIFSVKGGWQKLEETVNFLLLHSEQGRFLNHDILFSIFVDLVGSLLEISPVDNIFISQPCRDNVLYLLKLMDEMLASRISDKFLFPNCIFDSDIPSDSQPLDSQMNIKKSITKILTDEDANAVPRSLWCSTPKNDLIDDKWWGYCDKLWALICEMNGKRPDKNVTKSSGAAGPSFGQRARGLVESLNIPAAEMAAVVVSGGIGGALSGKGTKYVDKAMLLRGEKCPRIVFRLVIMYLCGASLERASKCVQQFIMLLPCLLPLDDEQNKNKLQQYIWYIAMMRSKFESSQADQDSSRSHIMSNLIREMVNYGKSILSTSTSDVDDALDINGLVIDQLLINNLIQIDRVSIATVDEATYIKSSKTDRLKQLEELKSRIDEDLVEELSLKKTLEEEIRSDINDILSSDDKRRAAYQIVYDENRQSVAEKWMHLLRALIDERGPWSANAISSSTLVHWKHDKTEDFWRRRPKLKRNYHFNERLCHPPAIASPNETGNPVSDSSGDKSFPEQMKHLLLKGVRGIINEGSLEPCDDANDATESKISDLDTSAHNQVSKEEFKDVKNSVHDMKSSLPSAEDKETSEVLLHIPCVLVTPKRKVAGHLSVMQTILRFSGNFLVEGTGGSSVFKKFDVQINSNSSSLDQIGETHKKNLPRETPKVDNNSGKATGMGNESGVIPQSRSKKIKRHWRWKITKIKSVHWTRYLLQYTAIEIFFNDSSAPVFLNFASSKDAQSVGTLIVSSRNEALYPRGSVKDRTCLISFVDCRVAVEMAETARESWKRREMSNFEYLIILNTLAGRSYNDLTQYPVFPWVLADYTSEKLDFNKSSTFRDLSKPVGALDPKRFEVFEDRYRNFCDPDIPSFFYGSHYSSMGIVLFYLLRMEPFTALHRNLQGDKFDHADRLFQSIGGTYSNCLSNTSDVKELIPEFFYMPEFLVNLNSYHLGVKQDGEPLADVVLPPWAKGSPEEFIYRNREALESEFVSSNLHHWIDLVFGYKQRGKPAVEAANVFYYLTYEGAVDLEAMDDELQISAIEDQIANFGQTPIQIFRKKHPRRGPPVPIAHPLYFAPASITLTSVVSIAAQSVSALLFIDLLDSNIVIVNEQYYLTVKMWITTQLQSGGNFTFSSSQDPFCGIGSDVLPLRRIGTPIAESSELTVQCFATLQAAGDNYLISCGSWDNSFQVTSLSDGKTVQSIRQHKDVVSCIAVTSDGSVIATGSYDTTVMVWNVCRTRITEKRLRSTEFTNKDHVIVESPLHILCGHDDIITCLFVSVELDIVISGSKDGTCIFHTLREGRYVRSIQHPSHGPLSKLVVSQNGRVVIYAESDLSLHMYSINGKHLAFCESNGRLNCINLSVCGEFLACAGDHGHITLRSMHSLEIVRRYEGTGKTITSLVVTPEECFLAGTKDGTLLVYSIENPQLRKVPLPRTRG